MYDPDLHARQLDLKVVEEPLMGRWGEYRRDQRTIALHPRLTQTQWRCVLAHEIVHAENDDVLTYQPWFDRRAESRADRIAAERLVHPADMDRAISLFPDNRPAMADELGITPWLLDALLRCA